MLDGGTGQGDFGGAVFDEVLHTDRIGFQVELQADDPGLIDEGLIGAGGRGSGVEGSRRDGERIAVPVEGVERVGKAGQDRIGRAGFGQRDLEPADFLDRIGRDRAAEHHGNKLGPQADAEDRLAGGHGFFDGVFLGGKPRMGFFVIDPHGAAHDDEQIEVAGGRRGLVGIPVGGGQAVAVVLDPGLDGPDPFEWNVMKRRKPHGPTSRC